MPAARASLASVAKRWAPAISPTSLAAVSGPNPGSVEQVRRDLGDQVGDLGFQRLDRLGQFADAAQLVAGDPDAHRLLGPSEPARDARAPLAVKQRAARELQLGPEIVQMPLQRVVDRDPLADQPLAVIDQQPQVELGPIQVRRRQACRALRAAPRGRPRARRCCRTCRARAPGAATPTSACCARAAPARRARSRTAPASPRHAGSPRSPTRVRRPGRAPSAAAPRRPWRPTGPSARRAASPDAAATAAIVCERLWVSAPSTIIDLVHLHFDRGWTARRTRLASGRCHAPIKSRRDIPDRRRATQRKAVRPQRPTA